MLLSFVREEIASKEILRSNANDKTLSDRLERMLFERGHNAQASYQQVVSFTLLGQRQFNRRAELERGAETTNGSGRRRPHSHSGTLAVSNDCFDHCFIDDCANKKLLAWLAGWPAGRLAESEIRIQYIIMVIKGESGNKSEEPPADVDNPGIAVCRNWSMMIYFEIMIKLC